MMSYLKYVVVLTAAYFVAWTVSYMFMVAGADLDFSHYFEYLTLAWTFSGGELPTFTWLFSIIAFLPLAVLAVRFFRKRKKSAKDTG